MLADSIDALIVTIRSPRPVEAAIIPISPGGGSADFEIKTGESALSVARRNHLSRSVAENYPAWITLSAPGFSPSALPSTRAGSFAPGALVSPRGKAHVIAIATGDTPEASLALARSAARSRSELALRRRGRMERLLAATYAVTPDSRFNRALSWAKLSLDALSVTGGGIYAGLPWFADYWGRDTFISLPGEALVTGRFAEARRILSLFASFQQRDSLSRDFGRIPNRVTSTDTAYNTADGTPRFVMAAREFAERSGDMRFALTMYPVVLRSIEGTIRYHTDSLGFLVHGDAETWMDAAGPEGPWSPRGNRANDIQALWSAQLEAGEYFATLIGDVTSARRWHDVLLRLRRNFQRYFVTPAGIADRLRPDGSADMTLRPNQVFTSRLLDEIRRERMVDTVVSRLTYAYGVASLSQDDPGFHPWHEYPPFYPKDAAYHNGTVWTWLQGPLISLLCAGGEQETAWQITENSVRQILDRGAAGTQSELLDAIPREGEHEPRLSGTFSQAWNLAEFVRNFYDDYLGARFNRITRTLVLEPRLPAALPAVTARVNAEDEALGVAVRRTPAGDEIQISSREARDSIRVHALLHISGGTYVTLETTLPPRSLLRSGYRGGVLHTTCNGTEWPSHVTGYLMPDLHPGGLHLAEPHLRSTLKALRGPAYPLLAHDLIMRTNPHARTLVDVLHERGADTARYSYPRNAAFVPGSCTIRRFTVSCDSALAYFTLTFAALSDPGWHPEYGFQLTFAAIAVDQDGIPGSGAPSIGRNGLLALDTSSWYEKIIYVGGGIQIEDARGGVLAAYVPVSEDARHPFGDAHSGTIRFALPLSLLGRPEKLWTFTVAAGAQDDHGGAGIGEFRTVNREQGEWNGGGKLSPGDPNIYDILRAHTREDGR
jgi:glycogen debranching enzyme